MEKKNHENGNERMLFGFSNIPEKDSYRYQCNHCGFFEEIPLEAITQTAFFFDRDDTTLPVFKCTNCDEGTVIPLDYPYSWDEHLL